MSYKLCNIKSGDWQSTNQKIVPKLFQRIALNSIIMVHQSTVACASFVKLSKHEDDHKYVTYEVDCYL